MEGRSLLERLFWVCAICAGLCVAGLMISATLRDADDNPIVTSVETIPVQARDRGSREK